MSTPHSRIAGVAVHLPETTMTTAELEDLLAARNPGLHLPRGLIHGGSGVRRRHLADPGDRPSDLAVRAARRLLDEQDVAAEELDLIIYAAVAVDQVEPATAHVVAARLGAACPVFDVRDACNGVLHGIRLADLLITAGGHRRILVCCGELPTAFMPWTLSGAEEFVTVAAAYTVSDAGAALLVERSAEPGVVAHRFAARSAAWRSAVMPIHDLTSDPAAPWPAFGPLVVNFAGLVRGVEAIGGSGLDKPLGDLGLTWDDFAVICVHQASLDGLWAFCERAGIPKGKVVVTIARHGNLATATLPVQLAQALEAGLVRRGDLVALVGLASGFSAGLVVVRW